MTYTRRITANLPDDLLEEAMETTGKGITDTLVEGLELVRRTRAHRKAMALKGRLALDVDLEVSRERRRSPCSRRPWLSDRSSFLRSS